MKTTNLLLAAVICCTALLSCEAPTPQEPALDMEQVQAEIEALEQAYAKAENARDAEAIVAYYADDAVSLPPEEPRVKGKQAILARMKAQMAENADEEGSIRFETLEVWAAGDIAVEEGSWIYTGPDGEETTGKFISVFEKQDGKYVCIRDIWNPDQEEKEEAGSSEE